MDKEKLMDVSGDEFFVLLEQYAKLKIPSTLKKVLILCSYDRVASVSAIDDNAITEIEEFMRNTFNGDIIGPHESVRDYLGMFSTIQAKYIVMGGEKKLLVKAAQVCATIYNEQNNDILGNVAHVNFITEASQGSNENVIDATGSRVKHSKLLHRIGAQIITVFNDAKRTSLSGFSWASRQVASAMAENYNSTGRTHVENIDLQYLSPTHHEELLDCIVSSDIENFQHILRNALAVSLRVDGSTDRTQEHNIYVMVQVITGTVEMKTYFLGFDVPASGDANDYFETTKSIVDNVIPWDELFPLITSLVTDGESLNSGRIQGLWEKMKSERLRSNHAHVPLIIVWCVAHRINLAWKSTTANELVKSAILVSRHVSAHFHRSGKRTKSLKSIAIDNDLTNPLRYPKYFEIRWCEFTFGLFYAILRNWRASVLYYRLTKQPSMLDCWLVKDRIHLLCFLADLLTILKTFQKDCESDSLSIAEIPGKLTNTMERLLALQNNPSENGWEQLFLDTIDSVEDDIIFFDEELTRSDEDDSSRFVADDRTEIIQSLITFLTQRMNEDAEICNNLAPLLHIRATVTLESLQHCHACIFPECDANAFITEYYQAAHLLTNSYSTTIYSNLKELMRIVPNRFVVLPQALARAASIKPHSADVERLINIYNKFKDDDRSSLSPATLFNYLYIKTNMCTLEEFDPTTAATHWLSRKQRKPRGGQKAKMQQWFNGVFKDSSNRKKHPKIIKF